MGFSLSDFEMLGVLGAGSYGRVTLVRYLPDNTLCALKAIPKSRVVTNRRISDIFRERSVLCREHDCPFVVRLIGAFQDATNLYFAMEYYEGGDLHAYLRAANKHRLRVEHARHAAAEVLVALRHLHSTGVLYRDLKPENVLVCKQGHMHLSDFGLAKEVAGHDVDEYRTHSVVGSPLYIAPEVLRKEAYNSAIDYWSFGVLLYRLLSGVVPFQGRGPADTYERILNGPLKFTSLILWDIQAKDLITKLLEKDPRKRLTGDAVRQHPFFQTIDWATLGQQPPPGAQHATIASRVSSIVDLSDLVAGAGGGGWGTDTDNEDTTDETSTTATTTDRSDVMMPSASNNNKSDADPFHGFSFSPKRESGITTSHLQRGFD
eukprot:PhM_4_TR622/c0_g1_i1/m.30067